MRIVSVVGTRPQLIKAAALVSALRARHHEIFVDTGQHYDEAMAGSFFAELSLPRPDYALGVGGGSHAEQTARMLLGLEPVLTAERPDAVLVYGDTNSTLAGALAASKQGIPVAHVEAGLRSFDRRMPEELNRVVADHLSRWLFVPTPAAVANLAAEGITSGVLAVGDLMQDLAARVGREVRDPSALAAVSSALGLALVPGGYAFATVHRAENRDPEAMRAWASILADAARARPVVLALHPGTAAALTAAGIALSAGVHVVPPQGYRTTLTLQLHAAAVLTDSGGVQREAAWLRTPCLILRDRTEWVEAVAESEGAWSWWGWIGSGPPPNWLGLPRPRRPRSPRARGGLRSRAGWRRRGDRRAGGRRVTSPTAPAPSRPPRRRLHRRLRPRAAAATCASCCRPPASSIAHVPHRHHVPCARPPGHGARALEGRPARGGAPPGGLQDHPIHASAADGLPLKGARTAIGRLLHPRRKTAPATTKPKAAAKPADADAADPVSDASAKPAAPAQSVAPAPRPQQHGAPLRDPLTIRSHVKNARAIAPAADLYHGMAYMGIPVALALGRKHKAPVVYDARDIYLEARNLAKSQGIVRWPSPAPSAAGPTRRAASSP
ncbi:MAG: UDP-N-acetylglucosamine 2-epimerase (non-hydrolyzing) [Chloroflexota bacterium]